MQLSEERSTPLSPASTPGLSILEGIVITTRDTTSSACAQLGEPPDCGNATAASVSDFGASGDHFSHSQAVRFAEDLEHVAKMDVSDVYDEEADTDETETEAMRRRVDRLALIRALLFVIVIPIIAFVLIGLVTIWVRQRSHFQSRGDRRLPMWPDTPPSKTPSTTSPSVPSPLPGSKNRKPRKVNSDETDVNQKRVKRRKPGNKTPFLHRLPNPDKAPPVPKKEIVD